MFNTTFVTNHQGHTLIIIILKMLITTDLISLEQTLNSLQSSIYRLGPKLGNSLSHNLMGLTSYSTFKTS